MAAPSRGCYIFVSICCFMVIPLGLLAPKVGPKLIDAWKFRKLGRPIPQRGRVVGYVWGAGYGGSISYELDLSGRVIRQWPGTEGRYQLERLANGNTLLFRGERGKETQEILELMPADQVAWQVPLAPGGDGRDLTRLANGNTLVAQGFDPGGGRAVELARDGAVVWEYRHSPANSAQRLAGGNTLVGGSESVEEVDPAGKVVWQKKGLGFAIHARRLANGNTLIAEYEGRRVVEVDRAGGEVWSHACRGQPMSAERLLDASTLVAQEQPNELLLIAPDGKEKTIATGLAHGKARPIYAGR